jgi:hypothetical protein
MWKNVMFSSWWNKTYAPLSPYLQSPIKLISLTAAMAIFLLYTWFDNKVRELATMCLPWQHWTKALIWFDDDISVFHSCVVVDI